MMCFLYKLWRYKPVPTMLKPVYSSLFVMSLFWCPIWVESSLADKVQVDEDILTVDDADKKNREGVETHYVIGLPSTQENPDLPPDSIVVERQQLAQFGSASLASVLEQLPSISINQNGGRGSFNGLFLRGADPNFTQVRIDGVPINDATNTRGGAFDISSINAQIIERIEIIADASSAVYGSQALAGIINIVTRSSSFESAIEFDSHGGQVASVFLAGDDVALSLVHERPESVVDGSNYESDELGAKANWQWADRHELKLQARHQRYRNRAFPDDSGGALFAASQETESRDGEVDHVAAHYVYQATQQGYLEIDSSFFQQQEDRIAPAVAPGLRDPFGLPRIISNTEYQRYAIEGRFTQQLNERLRWRSGLSWEKEEGDQTGELDFFVFQLPTDFNLNRTTLSVSQSLEYQVNNAFAVTVSGRVDDTESQTVFSPRVSASYAFNDNTQLFYATLGEGFKQASLYALGDPLVGNESLLDETAKSVQFGHRYRQGAWHIKHNAYYYRFDDLIDFEAGPPPSLVNRDSVKVRGVESIVSYKTESGWQWDMFHSYTSTDVVGSDSPLRQRPRYRAGLKVNYALNDTLNFWVKNLYVSERNDSSIPTADVVLDDYSLSDMGVQWRVNEHWQVNAQWKNIFDERYSHSVGNQINDDTVLLQLTYRGAPLF